MLFSEIVDGRFKVFSRMAEEEKQKNIGTVKYIQSLASLAGVDILAWDAKAIFGHTGNKLITDKNEINRRFWEEVDKISAAKPQSEGAESGEDLITEEVRAHLKNAESRHIASLLAKEQQEVDKQIREAQHSYANFEKYIHKAGEHFANIRRLTGSNSNLEEQIRQVAKSNFWKFNGVQGTQISFVTRANVVLNYKNQAAGIDMTINFGRYKATFNVADFSIRVTGVEKNIFSHGYPHPHVDPRGGICWGTAGNIVPKMLAACNFAEPMTMLATILGTYNPSSPMQSMENFQEVVGVPEEMEAKEAMDAEMAPIRARMRELDSLPIDLDRGSTGSALQNPAAPANASQPAPSVVVTATVTTANTSTTNVEIDF